MDPVDEVDVGEAGRAPHDPGSLGDAEAGVGGGVVRSDVGLGLDDDSTAAATAEMLAEERTGDGLGVASVKAPRERRSPAHAADSSRSPSIAARRAAKRSSPARSAVSAATARQ